MLAHSCHLIFSFISVSFLVANKYVSVHHTERLAIKPSNVRILKMSNVYTKAYINLFKCLLTDLSVSKLGLTYTLFLSTFEIETRFKHKPILTVVFIVIDCLTSRTLGHPQPT